MASRADIEAGKAFVRLYVKSSELVKGLQSAGQSVSSFASNITMLGAKMAGLGGAMVAPLIAAAKYFADFGSEIRDASIKTGVGVEALSEYSHALELTGKSLSDFEAASSRLTKKLIEAKKEGSAAAEAFSNIGTSADEILSTNIDDRMEKIAEHITAIADPAERAAAAMGIFGKSGADLLPFLTDVAALRKEARELGITMSTEAANAADELGDAWDRVTRIGKTLVAEVGAAVAPMFTEATQVIADNAATIRKWISENKETIQTAVKVGAALVAAGTAVMVLGSGLGIVGGLISGVAGFLAGLGGLLVSPFVLGAAAIGATVFAIGKLNAAFGLFKTEGLNAGSVLLWLGQTGRVISDFLGEEFSGIAQVFSGAWKQIVDSVMAGDLESAGQVAYMGLLAVFAELKFKILATWNDISGGVLMLWEDMSAGIASGTVELMAMLKGMWSGFESFAVSVWAKTSKAWLLVKAISLAEERRREESAARKMAPGADREAALAEIKERYTRLGKEVQGQFDGVTAGRQDFESQRKAEQDKIDADRRAAQKNIRNDWLNEGNAIESRRKEAADMLAKEKDTARNAFEGSRANAATRADAKRRERAGLPAAPDRAAFDIPNLADVKSKAFGSFSASALFAQGNGNDPQKIAAKKLEELAKAAKKKEAVDAAMLGELQRIQFNAVA
jgi:hypothetical protein